MHRRPYRCKKSFQGNLSTVLFLMKSRRTTMRKTGTYFKGLLIPTLYSKDTFQNSPFICVIIVVSIQPLLFSHRLIKLLIQITKNISESNTEHEIRLVCGWNLIRSENHSVPFVFMSSRWPLVIVIAPVWERPLRLLPALIEARIQLVCTPLLLRFSYCEHKILM